MVCDKDVGKMVCDKDACVTDGVTKKEAEEADWDEEPGGTDLKTRTPHKAVGKKVQTMQLWLLLWPSYTTLLNNEKIAARISETGHL